MGFHVAICGSGGWSRVHLRALASSPAVECVTLAARNAEAAATLAHEFPIVRQVVADWTEAIALADVAWIHVVLPHHLHVPVCQAALAAGKDVICEKPAATHADDFAALAQLATERGRRLLVVLNQLYNPVARKARQLVGSGALGEPFLSIENGYSRAVTHYRNPGAWRTNRLEAGGGVLIDGGFHMAYRHLYYLEPVGQPAWVTAETAQLNISPGGTPVPTKGEDFVNVTVGYPDALRIGWSHAWTLEAPPSRSRQSFLAGREATLEFTDLPHEPLRLLRPDRADAVAVETFPQTGIDTTHQCLLDLIAALAAGKSPEIASVERTWRTLTVIGAAYQSSRLGARQALKNPPAWVSDL